jgi:hypothetical protein
MNKLHSLLALILVIGAPGCFAQDFNFPVKFSVLVLDEQSGQPLEGALVESGFVQNFGDQPTIGLKFQSPTNGLVLFEGETSRAPNIALSKPGYYPVIYQPLNVPVQRTATRWEPWGATNVVLLKPILNPIRMVRNQVELTFPVLNKPVGFDLEQGDWVAPYGRGINADLLMSATNHFLKELDRAARVEIRFPDEFGGILPIETDLVKGSELKTPHQAPEAGYLKSFEPFEKVRPPEPTERNYEINGTKRAYLLRFRTEVDEQGRLKKAYYGKILSELEVFATGPGLVVLKFNYFLNPKANDRNIEHDHEKLVPVGSPGAVLK